MKSSSSAARSITRIGETPTVKTEITDASGAVYTVIKVTRASQAAKSTGSATSS